MATSNQWEEIINLFEYQNRVKTSASLEDLESFLDDIWKKREVSKFFADDENGVSERQNFLQLYSRTNELKSNKYVGCIQFNGLRLNLLPKIFYVDGKEYDPSEVSQIQNHILWWLSYCRKIKFPNYQSSLDGSKSDFFEVLIYLFSRYTRSLLGNSIFQEYEEVERELPFIKGRLNTSAYIQQNLSTGRWHKLNCTYETFTIDNTFNRIVKYVSTILYNVTNNSDNKKNLREILFILDEVADVKATAEQCAAIQFNPMMSDFETVRDYCHLFLSNCISFDYKNELKLFAFLLPMEYVFEDFVFGFIDKELESVKAKAQRCDVSLDDAGRFALKPDLFLKTKKRSLIADTKYKIVYSDSNDSKKGISQIDLYQMVAYSIRFDVDEIVLFYPNTISNLQKESSTVLVSDKLAGGRIITIEAFQLPIMDRGLIGEPLNKQQALSDLFAVAQTQLRTKLEEILN
jgi:5-methylcytosine-specific restriction enzyme subunit McrC